MDYIMGLSVAFIMGLAVMALAFGISVKPELINNGKATICAEINWKSPTCETIKQERLKP